MPIGGECVVVEQRVLAQRHLVPGDLVGQLGLAVGEVVREHAARRVVVDRGRRPLREQRLVATRLALLRRPDRRDDPSHPLMAARYDRGRQPAPSRAAASVAP